MSAFGSGSPSAPFSSENLLAFDIVRLEIEAVSRRPIHRPTLLMRHVMTSETVVVWFKRFFSSLHEYALAFLRYRSRSL
jgi:hypothetical protein